MQVLLTTIGVPPVGEQVIPRPRLLKVLQNGLARKVLLMVAEAGFGKTTLMAQLAHALDWPVAWYTVAESGRDPGTFLASVTTALEAVRADRTGGRQARPGARSLHPRPRAVRSGPSLFSGVQSMKCLTYI
ncbi:MAG: hypothetical protein ACREJ4_15350 [Candidatus Methylomirabilaceae bacterium]